MSSPDVRAASSTADADPVVVHVDLEDLPEELKAFNWFNVTAEDEEEASFILEQPFRAK